MSKKLIKIACFGNNFFVNIMQELKDHFKFDLKIIENIYDYSNTDKSQQQHKQEREGE